MTSLAPRNFKIELNQQNNREFMSLFSRPKKGRVELILKEVFPKKKLSCENLPFSFCSAKNHGAEEKKTAADRANSEVQCVKAKSLPSCHFFKTM